MKAVSYTGVFEKGEILFHQETFFLGRGLRAMCKRRFWKRASLFIGTPLGNLLECSFTGKFERQ